MAPVCRASHFSSVRCQAMAIRGVERVWRECVLVAGIAVALYLNSIPGGFVFDDHEAIETNLDVR